jgi:hypothetical protein
MKETAYRALSTQKKQAYLGFQISWSPTLFSGSGPVVLPPVPWTEKIELEVVRAKDLSALRY